MIPALALGLTLAMAGVSFAQNAIQTKSDNKTSCCSCCSDSCAMMSKDAKKNHAGSTDKDGCCSCCGDSCEMKKDNMKNHAMASDKDECCGGDSCDMKAGVAKTKGAAVKSSEKHDCCCGDSCNMKDKKTVTNMKDKS
jgi:hypothetical protein